jgi:predicted amidohydrolase YtcJ
MLYAYTINSARAVRREDRIGSIEPGKAADLVLVDKDLLNSDPPTIAEAKVIWTMYGGKKVFEAE